MSSAKYSPASSRTHHHHHDTTAEYSSLERLPREEVRVSMGRVIAAWGFGAAFLNVTSGAIYTAFARSLGANDFIFGVLAAALPVMSFLQVIAAKLVEGSGQRKWQLLVAGVAARSLWTFAALLPLLAPQFSELIGKKQVLNLVIGCVILAGAFQAFSTPAFFSWMTDLVPSRVRPAFFARRMQVGTWVAMMTAIVGGLIADRFPRLEVYCVLLAIAGVCGLLDILFFIGVREPRASSNSHTNTEDVSKEENNHNAPLKSIFNKLPLDKLHLPHSPFAHSPPLLEMIRAPLADAPTRRFLLFVSLLMFSYGLQGPFLWLHALEYLNLSKTVTGVLLNGVPLISMAISMRFWGDVIRRYGNRPVMSFCSMGIALASIGWLVARPGAWDLLPILLLFSGAMAGALELANQNAITGLSPHIPRSSMAAMFSMVAGLSFAAASWIGGATAQSLVWMNDGNYSLLGLRLVNYHVLFFVSLGLRLINATFIAPRLHEPEATGTVEVVKEVFPEVAQAFAARFTRPLGVRED